jgi:carboxylesterase type B
MVFDLNATNPVLAGTTIYSAINLNTFQPYIDGKTILMQPSEVGTKVPTIFGSSKFIGSAAPLIAKAYSLSAFNSTPFPAFFAMEAIITDVSYKGPTYRALNLTVQNGVPAWTYLWNHTPSCTWFDFIPRQALTLLGATHTAEIPFVFGNLNNLPLPNGTCSSGARHQRHADLSVDFHGRHRRLILQ